MYNPCFVGFLLQMNRYTCLIDRCLHVLYPASATVSSVVSSCSICKLILKVHKINVSRNTLLSVSCGNPRSKTPPCLRNSNHKYPPMPSDFQFKEPPLALGIPKSRPWYGMDIFSNHPFSWTRAQKILSFHVNWGMAWQSYQFSIVIFRVQIEENVEIS